MSTHRFEQSEGGPGAGDAGSEAKPAGSEGAQVDEGEAAADDVTAVPLGVPTSPENWQELKRRADEPGLASGEETSDPESD
jgi:hypothetical protein